MDRLHREGMPQDQRAPYVGAEVGEPVPGAPTCDGDDETLSLRGHGVQKGLRLRLHVAVQHDVAALVADADVHRTSVQVETAVKLGWFGVKSHEVSFSASGPCPTSSIPRWYVEEGASISIKGLQATP